MLRLLGHSRLSWLSSRLSGAQGSAYAAALGLIAIQVGIGIIMKAAQKGGSYEFSASSSVTISEFCKMLLSTFFFYRECRRRNATILSPAHTALPTSERSSFEEAKVFADEETNGIGEASGPRFVERHKDGKAPHLDGQTFWDYIKNEIGVDTRYGFAQLALFYALINNTASRTWLAPLLTMLTGIQIFVSYKLADPGTIQLTKSGVTFITALVMIATLGAKITKIQWIAIVIQVRP